MKILGLDYGHKHIGLSYADGQLAEPLATYPTATAVSSILHHIDSLGIEKLVVGTGDEHLLPDIQTFVARLNRPSLSVEYIDETLSSRDATHALLHTSPSRRKSKNHEVAATLILQRFLDN